MQVTDKPKTVCVECKWVYRRDIGGCCCTRNQEILGYSTVTGEPELAGMALCSAKNDGNCQDYEEK